MKSSGQKLKLLYMAQLLLEKTDDDHTLTVPQIISELERYGIKAERKSVYDDLEQLRLFGLDICSRKTKTHDYFIGSRDFELPELKLLVDSVQSSKFITHKKSMELISKIEKLTSHENAKKLHRQVVVTNRVKAYNEQIYYNVDKIYDAIANDRQISFKYFNLNINKEKEYRKNGEKYIESPISLTWDDENYYLITYKEKYGHFTHYRVDKMDAITITEEKRTMPPEDFDLSAYAKSVFSMFGGEETKIKIEFDNSLVGVVFDKFGTDISIIKSDESHFTCNVNVAVSPQFLAWVMSFGNKAKIISPENVIEDLKKLLKEINSAY